MRQTETNAYSTTGSAGLDHILGGGFTPNRLYLIEGDPGAGKTTLIHTLLGFHQPSTGSARIFGRNITEEAKRIRSFIGYMPERDAFIERALDRRSARILEARGANDARQIVRGEPAPGERQ